MSTVQRLGIHAIDAATYQPRVEDRRIDFLTGWREAHALYSAHEQTALAPSEEITLISEADIADEICTRTRVSTRQALADIDTAAEKA